jgi:hypothetical protein
LVIVSDPVLVVAFIATALASFGTPGCWCRPERVGALGGVGPRWVAIFRRGEMQHHLDLNLFLRLPPRPRRRLKTSWRFRESLLGRRGRVVDAADCPRPFVGASRGDARAANRRLRSTATLRGGGTVRWAWCPPGVVSESRNDHPWLSDGEGSLSRRAIRLTGPDRDHGEGVPARLQAPVRLRGTAWRERCPVVAAS